ncbi:MAG: carbohydrate ABC transporter permease [Actinomycetota bacterium]
MIGQQATGFGSSGTAAELTETRVLLLPPKARRAAAATRPGQRRLAPVRLLRGIVIGSAVAFALFPILSLVVMSLKGPSDILSLRILPSTVAWTNWTDVFSTYPIATYMLNSTSVAVLATLVGLAIAIPANYAIARLRAGGKNMLGIIVSVYIAPPVVAVVPLFLLVRSVGLMDTIIGLALIEALMVCPVMIWLLDSFFRSIPAEIDEAAQVDGCGPVTILLRVILPLVMPGVVAVGIISFVLVYNDFLVPLMLAQSAASQTLPVGISLMQGGREVMFGQMAAASLTGMIPVYLLALFMQRWLVGGLTHGSVK